MVKTEKSKTENQEEKKETCFIIMPITTPSAMKEKYDGEENHFKYVLEHLFVPAINRVDMKPIPPETKGSNVIHGDIIEKLVNADLVLCDMSGLNPNVFFELGIRTSLNKPVVLVTDDKTTNIPFDTMPIKYHTYASSLRSYNQSEEISSLIEHIKNTITISKKKSPMWKYFGLSSTAEPVEKKEGIEGDMEYLKLQMESINKNLANLPLQISPSLPDYNPSGGMYIKTSPYLNPTHQISLTDPIREKINLFLNEKGISTFTLTENIEGAYTLLIFDLVVESLLIEITKYVKQLGKIINIEVIPWK